MLQFPKISLRISYIVIIATLTVLPAALLSTYLIDRFEQIFTLTLEEKLEERTRRLGNELDLEIELLTIQLQQATTDLDLALAVHTGGYGNKIAQHKLKNIMDHHQMVSSLLLVDKELQVIDSVPGSALLLELASTQSWLQSQLNQDSPSTQPSAYIIKAPALIEQLEYYGAKHARTKWQQEHIKPLNNDYVMLFFVPISLSLTGSPTGADPLVGALVSLIPMQNLIDQIKYTALPTTLTNVRFEGERVFTSASPGDALLKIQHEVNIPNLAAPIKLQFSERKSTLHNAFDPLENDLTKITLLSLATAMLLALVITRLLIKPFNILSRIVTVYANGNYQPIKTKSRFKELHNIIHVLALMANSIKENQYELELRVKERTAELKSSNEELQTTMEQLKNMQSHLVEVEKMSILGQLVAGVAHEINTPVGVALTAASMDETNFGTLKQKLENNQLKKTDLEQHIASGTEASQMVIRNLKRAVELIRNFKEVAVDQSSEQRRRFNFSSYLNEVLSSLQAEIRRYNVTLTVDGNNDIELNSYPGVFAQIISNFVMNSLKHGFEPQRHYNITINFHKQDDQLHLSYQDSGKGVEQDALEKLFTPFFTTARGQGGTGLGLHIVYNLVSIKLGGTIQATSSPNQGIRFDLTFPITTQEETGSH